MTASDLERKAGLSGSSVRKILHGNSQNPTLETLSAIADVFNCSIDELVGKKVIYHLQTEENSFLLKDLRWNKKLIKPIIEFTCEFFSSNENNFSFVEMMHLIMEVYAYCMTKKSGEYDSSFHEWYLQKFASSRKK
jgi:transcriptional regulator with XRE-family HTH domain